jgi:hypothetical protein
MASGGSTGYWTVEAMRQAEVQAAVGKAVAAERERVCKIADDVGARYLDGGDWSASARLSDLIRRLADG